MIPTIDRIADTGKTTGEDTFMHRVLIVDDDADIRKTLDMILRYEKYETLLAKDGEAALRQLEDPGADLARCGMVRWKYGRESDGRRSSR